MFCIFKLYMLLKLILPISFYLFNVVNRTLKITWQLTLVTSTFLLGGAALPIQFCLIVITQ